MEIEVCVIKPKNGTDAFVCVAFDSPLSGEGKRAVYHRTVISMTIDESKELGAQIRKAISAIPEIKGE